jgi:hypothetical protein
MVPAMSANSGWKRRKPSEDEIFSAEEIDRLVLGLRLVEAASPIIHRRRGDGLI